MAATVFMQEMMSLPAPSAALAISEMLVTFGVSLVISGRRRGAPDGFDHPGGHRRIGPEDHPAFFYVRAAHVYLQGGYPRRPIEPGGKFGIFLDRVAEDVYDHRNAQIAQKRELYGQKPFDPDIFQADCVYHACRGFDQAGRRVPGAGFERNPLHHDGPEAAAGRRSSSTPHRSRRCRMRS